MKQQSRKTYSSGNAGKKDAAKGGKFSGGHGNRNSRGKQSERGNERSKDGHDSRDGEKRFPAKTSFATSRFKTKHTQNTKPIAKLATKLAVKLEKPVKTPRQGILLWGIHAVREAWLNPKRVCYNISVSNAGMAALEDAFAATTASGMPRPAPQIVDRDELERMLPPSSVHQGVALEVAPLPEITLDELLESSSQPDLLVVLDQVTDPHNVGAILRSAVAFQSGAVIMTERNAPGTTGIMAKTASGAVEHVPLIHVVNLSRALTTLQKAGYWCVGLAEQGERDLGALDLTGKTALVLGAEGEGLRRLTRENCDELARLPTGGNIGSLNVSNAAAVALYEARRQRATAK